MQDQDQRLANAFTQVWVSSGHERGQRDNRWIRENDTELQSWAGATWERPEVQGALKVVGGVAAVAFVGSTGGLGAAVVYALAADQVVTGGLEYWEQKERDLFTVQGLMYVGVDRDVANAAVIGVELLAGAPAALRKLAGKTGSLTKATGSGLSRRIGIEVVEAGPVDRALAREIAEELASDPLAARAYRQLQEGATTVKLHFGAVTHTDAGIFNHLDNTVTIFMQNTRSRALTVRTLIHESSHAHRLNRGSRFYGTQLDEYRAWRREFLYRDGRPMTLPQRESLREWIRNHPIYGELPEY